MPSRGWKTIAVRRSRDRNLYFMVLTSQTIPGPVFGLARRDNLCAKSRNIRCDGVREGGENTPRAWPVLPMPTPALEGSANAQGRPLPARKHTVLCQLTGLFCSVLKLGPLIHVHVSLNSLSCLVEAL